jgi:Flp pilus assembly pilin Flp
MPNKLCRTAQGQAKIEYVPLIGLVALVTIGALIAMGPGVSDIFKTVKDELANPTPMSTATAVLTPTSVSPTEAAPTPTPEPEERLSHSDFEDGDELDWYEAEGKKWGVDNGEYCADSGGKHSSFTGDETWTDYVIDLQARLDKGNGFGVYFRATDPDAVNGYCFQYDPGYGKGAFLFRQVVNGREQSPSVVEWAPTDYDWYGPQRQIRVQVVGNTYTAFVDGVQVAQLVDDSYTRGAVGLHSWDGSDVCFDDVTVTRIR